MIRHDSRTATVVLWEIAGKKVLTAKSSSSWSSQASLDLAWPWKPCIAQNHSFAATAPKRLDLKTPQSDVCAWFGKSPMDANTAHCASLIKINEKQTTTNNKLLFSHIQSIFRKPTIVDQSCAFWINYDILPNETCWMWSFLECKPGSLACIFIEKNEVLPRKLTYPHLADRKSS